MKDINEVLRKRELDLQQLQRDVEALRIAARLLSEEADAATVYAARAVVPVSSYAPPPPRPAPTLPANDPGLGVPWNAAAKKFP